MHHCHTGSDTYFLVYRKQNRLSPTEYLSVLIVPIFTEKGKKQPVNFTPSMVSNVQKAKKTGGYFKKFSKYSHFFLFSPLTLSLLHILKYIVKGMVIIVIRKHLLLSGSVQGVGLRYRTKYAASMRGLTGWVRNLSDGSVEMEVQGKEEEIDMLLQLLQQNRYIDITGLSARTVPLQDDHFFEILDDD